MGKEEAKFNLTFLYSSLSNFQLLLSFIHVHEDGLLLDDDDYYECVVRIFLFASDEICGNNVCLLNTIRRGAQMVMG